MEFKPPSILKTKEFQSLKKKYAQFIKVSKLILWEKGIL